MSLSRVSSLDLLRGIAAFAVAIPHYFVYRTDKAVGAETISILAVEIFFVLSGFVLAPQIIACAQARGALWQSYRIFLIRRWMRTVPPYLVSLFCMTVIVQQVSWPDALRYVLYLQNLLYQANSVDYFPIAWSLSVEEWFYVTFPLFLFAVVALARRADLSLIAMSAAAYILLVVLLRTVFEDPTNWGYEVRRVTIFRLDSIACGILLYLWVDWLRTHRPTLLTARRGFSLLLAAGCLLLFSAAAYHVTARIGDAGAPMYQRVFPIVAALMGASAIVLACLLEENFARRPRLKAVSLFLGQISYPVYLFHLIVLTQFGDVNSRLSQSIEILIYLSALVTFSTLFHFYFEKPILAARPNFPHGLRWGIPARVP